MGAKSTQLPKGFGADQHKPLELDVLFSCSRRCWRVVLRHKESWFRLTTLYTILPGSRLTSYGPHCSPWNTRDHTIDLLRVLTLLGLKVRPSGSQARAGFRWFFRLLPTQDNEALTGCHYRLTRACTQMHHTRIQRSRTTT